MAEKDAWEEKDKEKEKGRTERQRERESHDKDKEREVQQLRTSGRRGKKNRKTQGRKR